MSEIGRTPESIDNNLGGKISRRQFIRAALTAGLLLLGGQRTEETSLANVSPTGNKTESETEKKSGRIQTIDLFGNLKNEISRLHQDNSSSAERHSDIIKRLGVSQAKSWEELSIALPETENEKLALLLEALRIHYTCHGEEVVKTRQRFAQNLTSSLKPSQSTETMTQLAGTIKIKENGKDKLGNPVLWFEVDADLVKKTVQSSTDTCINMSFEMGQMKIIYDMYGNFLKNPDAPMPKIPKRIQIKNNETGEWENHTEGEYFDPTTNEKISEEKAREMIKFAKERVIRLAKRRAIYGEDGYAGEKTFENLSLLAEIARENPNKMFIAAAGNPTTTLTEETSLSFTSYRPETVAPDITKAKKQLQKESLWPDNLIMVGVVGKYDESSALYAFGADIYVKAPDIKIYGDQKNPGSSFATPMVTEIVSRLQKEGINNPRQIRAELINLTGREESSGQEWFVLNIEKVKSRFSSQRQ